MSARVKRLLDSYRFRMDSPFASNMGIINSEKKMKFVELVEQYCPFWLQEFRNANIHLVQGISNFLEQEMEDGDKGLKNRITPRIELILSTFYLVSMDPYDLFPNSLKVVWMFQDVYPTPGAACGVATCTLNGVIQPTLSNIYKRMLETYKPKKKVILLNEDPETHERVETEQELDIPVPRLVDGDIRGWCTQGVLMWNAAMSTRERETEAHLEEWSLFSQQMMKWMSDTFPYIVFVLFGKKAQLFKKYINASKHTILETSHPSGRGYFYGFDKCNIFNEVNDNLVMNGRKPIEWGNYNYISE